MRVALTTMLSVVTVSLAAVPARAEEPAPPRTVAVVRDQSAADCPDGAAIVAEVAVVAGSASLRVAESGAAPSVVVRFARNAEDGIVATVEPKNGGKRRFVDAKRECASLAKVVAVALAVWLDEPESNAEPAPAPPSASAAPPVRVVPDVAPEAASDPANAEPPRKPLIDDLQLAALAQVSVGITASAAIALGVHARAGRGPFSIGVGGRWSAPDESSVGPARVRRSALGGFADGCVAIAGPHGLVATWQRIELHPCGTFALAAVTAESSGVAATDRVTSSWLGAGAALVGVVRPLGWLGLGVRAEALIPFDRERFVVIGAGAAYTQAQVAAFLGGGIVIDVL